VGLALYTMVSRAPRTVSLGQLDGVLSFNATSAVSDQRSARQLLLPCFCPDRGRSWSSTFDRGCKRKIVGPSDQSRCGEGGQPTFRRSMIFAYLFYQSGHELPGRSANRCSGLRIDPPSDSLQRTCEGSAGQSMSRLGEETIAQHPRGVARRSYSA
jgi:hypothetical protein